MGVGSDSVGVETQRNNGRRTEFTGDGRQMEETRRPVDVNGEVDQGAVGITVDKPTTCGIQHIIKQIYKI